MRGEYFVSVFFSSSSPRSGSGSSPFAFSAGSEHCLAPCLDEVTKVDDDVHIAMAYSAPKVLEVAQVEKRGWTGTSGAYVVVIACCIHLVFPAWLQQTHVNSATWAHSSCKSPAG